MRNKSSKRTVAVQVKPTPVEPEWARRLRERARKAREERAALQRRAEMAQSPADRARRQEAVRCVSHIAAAIAPHFLKDNDETNGDARSDLMKTIAGEAAWIFGAVCREVWDLEVWSTADADYLKIYPRSK